MSEEMNTESPIANPKQYLLMADEVTMPILGKLIPGLLYVQVEGMAMQGNDNHMLLVNPMVKPTVPTIPLEGVKPEEV